jgi:hypothetical protein
VRASNRPNIVRPSESAKKTTITKVWRDQLLATHAANAHVTATHNQRRRLTHAACSHTRRRHSMLALALINNVIRHLMPTSTTLTMLSSALPPSI